jgi:hypothetical protein
MDFYSTYGFSLKKVDNNQDFAAGIIINAGDIIIHSVQTRANTR